MSGYNEIIAMVRADKTHLNLFTNQPLSSKEIKKAIDAERNNFRRRKEREVSRMLYLSQLLTEDRKLLNEYGQTYNELFDHAEKSIQSRLVPMKQFYYAHPMNFDSRDPHLSEKAIAYFEKLQEKHELHLKNFERNKLISKIIE